MSRGAPGRAHEVEIERQVEAVARAAVVGHQAVERQIGLADRGPARLRTGRSAAASRRPRHAPPAGRSYGSGAAAGRAPCACARRGFSDCRRGVRLRRGDGWRRPGSRPHPGRARRPSRRAWPSPRRVSPVQVGLRWQERMIVVLAGRRIQRPGGTAELGSQLFGGPPSGAGSRQMYQSRRRVRRGSTGFRRTRDAASDVWFGTKSRINRRPSPCAASTSRSKVGRSPKSGSIARVVADVVAEVLHRRAEDRRQPEGVDTKVGQMVEARQRPPPGRRHHRRWCPGRTADRSDRSRRASTRWRRLSRPGEAIPRAAPGRRALAVAGDQAHGRAVHKDPVDLDRRPALGQHDRRCRPRPAGRRRPSSRPRKAGQQAASGSRPCWRRTGRPAAVRESGRAGIRGSAGSGRGRRRHSRRPAA